MNYFLYCFCLFVTTAGCNSTYFDELFINLKSIKTCKALLLLGYFD